MEENNNGTIAIKSKTTPFTIVKIDDNGYRVAVGRYIVTEETFRTIETAEDYINSKPYELIINTILILLENEKQAKTEKTNSQNNK